MLEEAGEAVVVDEEAVEVWGGLLRHVRVGLVQDVWVGRGAGVLVIGQAVIVKDCRVIGVNGDLLVTLEYTPVLGLCS